MARKSRKNDVAEIEAKSKMYRTATYMQLSVVKNNIPSYSNEKSNTQTCLWIASNNSSQDGPYSCLKAWLALEGSAQHHKLKKHLKESV